MDVISTGVAPYTVDVSSRGELGVVSNVGLAGLSNVGQLSGDADCVTLLDLSARPFRALQYLTVPSIPEGVALSLTPLIHPPSAGPIAVTVEWLSGRAMLHVFDAGLPLDASVVTEVADVFDEHGRGLAIVQGLSPGVLVDNAYSQGKTVSVELPVHLA